MKILARVRAAVWLVLFMAAPLLVCAGEKESAEADGAQMLDVAQARSLLAGKKLNCRRLLGQLAGDNADWDFHSEKSMRQVTHSGPRGPGSSEAAWELAGKDGATFLTLRFYASGWGTFNRALFRKGENIVFYGDSGKVLQSCTFL